MTNLLGILMLLFSAILFAILKLFLSIHIAAMLFCISLVLSDLIYRFMKGNKKLWNKQKGGSLIFIPMWLWGIIMAIVYYFNYM